jgi:hypothetical protein
MVPGQRLHRLRFLFIQPFGVRSDSWGLPVPWVGGLVGLAIGRSISGSDEEPADTEQSNSLTTLEVSNQHLWLTVTF